MIVEVLRHLLIPCPRPLRRLGVLYHLIALEARARRCAAAWRPHIEDCHAFVEEAVAACPRHGRLVILGSGPGLEFPLERLAATFDEVVLVDLLHMPGIRRRARRLGNVHPLAHDLTGVVGVLSGKSPPATLPPPAASLPPAAMGADLVISLNLLSQLPLIPLDAAARAGLGDEDSRTAWAAALVADHLALLMAQPGQKALLADVMARWYDPAGRLVLESSLLFGQSLPPLKEELVWEWNAAPAPEADRILSLRRRVVSGWL